MKKNLTAQQKKFILEYNNGKSAVASYRSAYNCNNKSSSLVSYEANKLLNNELILKEISLQKEKQTAFLNYTAENSFNKINEIQEKALEKNDLTNALKAEEMKCKLAGLFKEKEAVTVGAVGDFRAFYASICQKKDYGSAPEDEKAPN